MNHTDFGSFLKSTTPILAHNIDDCLLFSSQLIKFSILEFFDSQPPSDIHSALLRCAKGNNLAWYQEFNQYLCDKLDNENENNQNNQNNQEQTLLSQLTTVLDCLINCYDPEIQKSKNTFVYNLNCFLHNLLCYCQINAWIKNYPQFHQQWSEQRFDNDFVSFADCWQSKLILGRTIGHIGSHVKTILDIDYVFDKLEEKQYVSQNSI